MRKFLFIALVIVLSLIGAKSGLSADYQLKIAIDKERKEVKGEETVSFINKAKEGIEEVYFYLYPQVFGGRIKVEEVKTEGKWLSHTAEEGFLKVSLPEKLLPGKKIVLSLKFRLNLLEKAPCFGYYEELIYLTNWYPILSVYEEEGWFVDSYEGLDGSLYSEISSYEVEVILPLEEIVATTGEIVKEEVEEGQKRIYLKADKVRDFALVMSPEYKSITGMLENKEKTDEDESEEKSKDTEIEIYYLKGEGIGETILSMAEEALVYFSSLLGEYPFQKLHLAQVYGEEVSAHSALVLIGDGLWSSKNLNSYRLEYRVAYGIARQWWSQIVGANEAKEPFLMEALANYSALMYLEEKFGKDRANALLFSLCELPYWEYVKSGNKDLPILSSLKNFDFTSYEVIAKGKGTIVFSMLRYLVGDETFSNILQTFFSQYKYSQATTRDFQEISSQVFGRDLKWFFEEWLTSTKEIDYEVSEVISQKLEGEDEYQTSITLTQNGTAIMPAEVLIELKNGERIIKAWEKDEKVKKYNLFTEETVSFIEIDPEQKVLEKVRENNIKVSRSYTRRKILHLVLGLFLWDVFSLLMIGIALIILSLFFRFWDKFRERKPLVSLVVIFASLFACKIAMPYLFLGMPSAGISEAILEAASSLSFLFLIISFLVAGLCTILVLRTEKLDLAQGKVLIQAFAFWIVLDVLVNIFPYLFII